jgi:hypothetical protein
MFRAQSVLDPVLAEMWRISRTFAKVSLIEVPNQTGL